MDGQRAGEGRKSEVVGQGGGLVLALISEAGPRAGKRFVEFFTADIRNPNTREAYARAVGRFLGWCEVSGLDLPSIEPLHVASYIEGLQSGLSKPSVKQHLAALKRLFDWLVTGQVLPTNPASSVRGPKHVVRKGKTPVLMGEEARE
ncbi:MAG: site-specific integrase, partial [Singulisphaera sp.]